MNMCDNLKRSRSTKRSRKGQITVLFAFLLVVILAVVALAVDVGLMSVRKTEIQRSVDAACLAGVNQLEVTEDPIAITNSVKDSLNDNGIDANSLPVGDFSVDYGYWDQDTRLFTTTKVEHASAVQVFTRLQSQPLGFGRVFGASAHQSQARATAVHSAEEPRDIMLVIDCSGSMNDDSSSPEQPMTAVKNAAQALVSVLRDVDRVGLTVYSKSEPYYFNRLTGYLEVDLTDNFPSMTSSIGYLNAGYYTGGTNIAGGIRVGGQALQTSGRGSADWVMIVLTDGQANRVEPPYGVPSEDLPNGDPADDPDGDAAASARGWAQEVTGYGNGIQIHTVSIGFSADHDLMANIASDGGGDHYRVEGTIADYSAELQGIFRKVGHGKGRRVLVD